MGGRKCIVPGCPSAANRKADRGVTFHKVPLNEKIKRQWIEACRLAERPNSYRSGNVCSRHFRRADFQEFKGKKFMLKTVAVPSIFNWTKPQRPDALANVTVKEEEELCSTPDATPRKLQYQDESFVHEVGDMYEDDSVVVKVEEPEIKTEPDAAAPVTPKTPAPSSSKKSSVSTLKRKSASKRSASARKLASSKKQPRVELVAPPASPKKQTPKKAGTSTVKPHASPEMGIVAGTGGSERLTSFTPGTKIEAQDFSGRWHSANLVEVDTEEREVLVQFEKAEKSKTILNDEWIPMDSVRLRPVTQHATYTVGEKVFARWSDSRKFKATIQSILENDMYEVMFEDGFAKICKSSHISRLKRTEDGVEAHPADTATSSVEVKIKTEKMEPGTATEESNMTTAAMPSIISLEQFRIPQVAKLADLPPIPQDGEWCCHWMNDYPVGESSELDLPGGKVYSVIVPDWRMPEGWQKHIYQRVTTFGKIDIVLVSPSGKPFRSRLEVKQHLDEQGELYDPMKYDFGLHKKRAKDLGFYGYTQEYRDAFLSAPVAEPVLLNTEVNIGSVKVKIIDNLYQCPEQDCLKTFRKENHLQIHIKHYHHELAKGLGEILNMQDLAQLRTPIEILDTPVKTVARKSTVAGTGSTSKAASKDDDKKLELVLVKREPGTEGEWDQLQKTPVATKHDAPERIKPGSSAVASGDASVSKVKQEPNDGAGPLVASKNNSVTTPAAGFANHSTSSASKSKSSKKKPKIKLFSLKKTGNRPFDSSKVRRVGKSSASKRKKSRAVAAAAAKQAIPRTFLNRPAISGEVGSPYTPGGYPYGEDASMSSFYDDSINAANLSLVDDNGEAIKIVRMRKEEIINCVCKITEEDGLMVQCDVCLCWQHGFCQNFFKDSDVPDTYVCSICRNPYRGRSSKRYGHHQDWLYEGKLPVARYHSANTKHTQRFDILKNVHTLSGNLVELKRFIHSMQVKINIAERKEHPKLYLWSKKWEKSPPRGGEKVVVHSVDPTAPKPMPQIPVPEAPIDPAECQANLLDHIQKQQNDAMARLQAIEAQIIGLEAFDDKADLLESPTETNYPKSKQTIHMLLNDLMQMKKIAAIHADFSDLAQAAQLPAM
ncbi:phd finger [Anopheles darlingi]|uniref:Phd finger n=1 Tax=Anopheles darlingi TaxID=43151 RepID=W5JPC4_ANODA|nr:phd finger [Anopheles darlingi]